VTCKRGIGRHSAPPRKGLFLTPRGLRRFRLMASFRSEPVHGRNWCDGGREGPLASRRPHAQDGCK
jgi:hypothetical protein